MVSELARDAKSFLAPVRSPLGLLRMKEHGQCAGTGIYPFTQQHKPLHRKICSSSCANTSRSTLCFSVKVSARATLRTSVLLLVQVPTLKKVLLTQAKVTHLWADAVTMVLLHIKRLCIENSTIQGGREKERDQMQSADVLTGCACLSKQHLFGREVAVIQHAGNA